jgi:hypothetical protein
MIVEYRDSEGRRKKVKVRVDQENTVHHDGRRVVFTSEIRGVHVEEAPPEEG